VAFFVGHTIYAPLKRCLFDCTNTLTAMINQLNFNLYATKSTNLRYYIANSTGQVLKRFKKTSAYGLVKMQISIADLPKGMYVLVVEMGKRKIVKRISKV